MLVKELIQALEEVRPDSLVAIKNINDNCYSDISLSVQALGQDRDLVVLYSYDCIG